MSFVDTCTTALLQYVSRSYLFVHSRYVRLGTPFLQGVWRRSIWQWNGNLVVNARYESSDIKALQHEKPYKILAYAVCKAMHYIRP